MDYLAQIPTATRTYTTTSSPRLPQTPEPVLDSTQNNTTAISPPDQPKTRLTVPPEIVNLWMYYKSRLLNPDLYFIPPTVHRPDLVDHLFINGSAHFHVRLTYKYQLP